MCRPLSDNERFNLDAGLGRLIDWADTNNTWVGPDGYSDVGVAVIDAVMAAGNEYDGAIRPIMGHIVGRYSNVPTKDANWLITELATLAPLNLPASTRGDLLVTHLLENARPMLMGRKGTRPRGLVIEDTVSALLSYRSNLTPSGLGTYASWAPVKTLTGNARKDELRTIYKHLQLVDGMGEATSRYLAILLGCPEVKPDIHTRWFFEEHSGTTFVHSDQCVGDELVLSAERQIAAGDTVNPVTWIDHLMWRQKSRHVICSDGRNC